MNYFEQGEIFPQFACPFYMNRNTYSTTNNTNYSKEVNSNDTATTNLEHNLAYDIQKSYESRLSRATKLDETLEMIRASVADELNDELFYTTLINQAMTDEEREIISNIRNDEIKHNKLLRNVYRNLTNITLPEAKAVDEIPALTYTENLRKAFMGESAAASKYRHILNNMPDRANYNILMEIMVDELRHASKYNYLMYLDLINRQNSSNNNTMS